MPHRDYLSPWDIRITVSQLRGRSADGVRWCSIAGGKTSSLKKESSDVAATMASILRQASRMSFRKDGSCRIDDPGISESLRAYPGLQPVPRNQIDSAPGEDLQFLSERFEFDQTDSCPWFEFYLRSQTF